MDDIQHLKRGAYIVLDGRPFLIEALPKEVGNPILATTTGGLCMLRKYDNTQDVYLALTLDGNALITGDSGKVCEVLIMGTFMEDVTGQEVAA